MLSRLFRRVLHLERPRLDVGPNTALPGDGATPLDRLVTILGVPFALVGHARTMPDLSLAKTRPSWHTRRDRADHRAVPLTLLAAVTDPADATGAR
jgi:hypothetical protein